MSQDEGKVSVVTPPQQKQEDEKSSATYRAGCHCGFIKFSVALTPALPHYKVLNCNCSACTRSGYLLVYPEASSVTWHKDSRARCSNYRFNTKDKDQMFCKHCGASIGIDFREVRTFFNIDLDSLTYHKLDGRNAVPPAGDLSGQYWDEEAHELK
uniref:CENP-V/GFA domain-containing protein n=1 Tax=Floropilus chiversii TaxID=2587399 RepID=C5H880_FLOCH|nr:hypothetical protein [Floropilus chiversii]